MPSAHYGDPHASYTHEAQLAEECSDERAEEKCAECGAVATTRLRTCNYVDEAGTALCCPCADRIWAHGEHYECPLEE